MAGRISKRQLSELSEFIAVVRDIEDFWFTVVKLPRGEGDD